MDNDFFYVLYMVLAMWIAIYLTAKMICTYVYFHFKLSGEPFDIRWLGPLFLLSCASAGAIGGMLIHLFWR